MFNVSILRTRKLEGFALIESRFMAVGTRLAQPLVDELRAKNDAVWSDRRNWVFGFYFGAGDTRLWAPPRRRRKERSGEKLVINFMHPEGRRALPILFLGYFIAGVNFAVLVAIACGARW